MLAADPEVMLAMPDVIKTGNTLSQYYHLETE